MGINFHGSENHNYPQPNRQPTIRPRTPKQEKGWTTNKTSAPEKEHEIIRKCTLPTTVDTVVTLCIIVHLNMVK